MLVSAVTAVQKRENAGDKAGGQLATPTMEDCTASDSVGGVDTSTSTGTGTGTGTSACSLGVCNFVTGSRQLHGRLDRHDMSASVAKLPAAGRVSSRDHNHLHLHGIPLVQHVLKLPEVVLARAPNISHGHHCLAHQHRVRVHGACGTHALA